MSPIGLDDIQPTSFAVQPARAALRLIRRALAAPGLLLSILILTTSVLWAIAPSAFSQFSAVDGRALDRRLAPNGVHWLGTDGLGRDLLARIIHGAAETLSSAAVAVAVGLVIGVAIGVIAGSLPRRLDDLLMRLVDVLLALPPLLLALSIVIVLGVGTFHAAIAVGVTSIAKFARLTRSEVIRVRRADYVEAAFGVGGTFATVLIRHVLPNAMTPVLAFATVQLGSAILLISTLGFLGLGAPPPTPEWGLLIAEGRNYLATAWWISTFPGIAVILIVLATNRLGRALQGTSR